MGNYKFKLSDMIPNAWFYKLRDIGKTRKQNTTPSRKKKQSPLTSTTQQSSKPNQPHQCNNPRKSYYFTRELDPTSNKIYTSPSNTPKFSPDPPRKSSKQRRTKKRTITKSYSPKVVNSSVSSGCNFHTTLESYSYSSSQFDSSTESEFPDPEFRTDRVLLPVNTTKNLSYTYRHKQDNYNSSSNNEDIVIDVDKNSLAKRKDGYEFDSFSEVELPPIITKPVINDDVSQKETKPREQQHNKKGSMKVKIVKENTSTIKEQRNSPVRRFSMSSSKVKVHVNSPRIERRKVHSHGRKIALSSSSRRSLSDSFAIVKSSFNPQKDFRESMMEMIVENNLRGSKDLEDLLACYLSLNSDEYHDIIIKVFKQIWFDFTEKR
ncbi:PREDICTED: transcription repressor OFP1-like isoform X2 [Lupinus angustifolius]|uniref:transcription repressor OFP1-like isoform X2 n=1 Tax=Lupinus angustifolius TaxID=3871 RepID=UPI00092F0DB2|nr:PREDICTED: transcription repressor OFP1-like isoform X2 [Lupinus angustifolius]